MSNQNRIEPFKIVVNPPMANGMIYEYEKDRADYYKRAYENEKAKNEYLEKQADELSKMMEKLYEAYIKIQKKYDDAVSKSAQILRSKQD